MPDGGREILLSVARLLPNRFHLHPCRALPCATRTLILSHRLKNRLISMRRHVI
jgi:hypothetical protein